MQVRPKLTIERTFDASIEDVWELWTTREGIESWWGPEGFSVAVQEMEMRPGGKLVYEMTATGPDEVETVVELSEVEDGVRMVLTFDAMHDDDWTQRAKLGRESELEKLANLLAARK